DARTHRSWKRVGPNMSEKRIHEVAGEASRETVGESSDATSRETVGESSDATSGETVGDRKVLPRRPGGSAQHGIAVLLVVACLAILAPFTMSFNYQARVDWQSAVNVRDEVSARHIQRGAMQLSLLLFEIQRMVFNQKQFRDFMGTMDITQVAPYLMSVFGTSDGAEGLGALAGVDGTVFKDLALTEGSFEFRVYAESGKINVNCLANQKDDATNPAARTMHTLDALMSPQIYNPLFEEEKSDGQYYTRQEILAAMADYVDDDRQRFDVTRGISLGGNENYRYAEL